jgi:hypothetical protein
MALQKTRITAIVTLVLIAVTALASCSTPGEEIMPTDDQLQIGEFAVELQKTEADDVAQILGISRWKFTLQRDSEQEVGLEAALSITSPDGPVEVIDEIRIFTTESEVDGMVAIYPLGESLFNADEIRIYMQLGSGSTSSVISNPFKEFSSSYTANPADVLDDGSLRLMAFSDNEPMPSPENTVLSLSIDTFSE